MLERQLSRMLRHAFRRAAGERSLSWAAIGLAALVLRRALRDDDDTVARVKVRRGRSLTVSVREPMAE